VQLHWYEGPDGARMPWIRLGPASARDAVALPGLSDGLMPLSTVRPRAGVAARPGRRLPFHARAVSYRHPLPAGTTTADLADDVARYVDEVVGHPVVVTAHSMGGMVAQWLAVRRPDLVQRLVLTATLARPDDTFRACLRHWEALVADGDWRGFAEAANAASYTGSELLRRRLLLRVARPPAAPDLVDRHRVLTAACLDHDTSDVLAEIACPTLVLAGAVDPVVAPSATRAMADAIPGATFELFDGLAHGFPEQSPARTLAAIRTHLGAEVAA
jgi:pimeloyl-ACP methyl ester carboxylesterase